LARDGQITIRKVAYNMATGTIKTLIPAKGFGFISTDGSSKELFFHSSSVLSGEFDSLQVGQAVSFEQEPDPRDPSRSRAKNVRLSEDGA
jgi:CspA family cold shock protein